MWLFILALNTFMVYNAEIYLSRRRQIPITKIFNRFVSYSLFNEYRDWVSYLCQVKLRIIQQDATVIAESLDLSWWRHHMETHSALLALCAWNSPVTGTFPSRRPVTRSLDAFFDLHLNKQLSKRSRRWWFGMPSHSLWRHCNVQDLRSNGHRMRFKISHTNLRYRV